MSSDFPPRRNVWDSGLLPCCWFSSFSTNLKTFPFPPANYGSLDLCCALMKRGPYPVNQVCCLFFSSRLSKLFRIYSKVASRFHLPTPPWSIWPYMYAFPSCDEVGSPTWCLVVLLYTNLPIACHIQITPHSSTHAYISLFCFTISVILFQTWFLSLKQHDKSFYW